MRAMTCEGKTGSQEWKNALDDDKKEWTGQEDH